jgi:hypothetical protein
VSSLAQNRRLQHRISIDAGMGDLYHWLASLDTATRSREVLYLMRLGSEVHFARKAVLLAIERDGGRRAGVEAEQPSPTGFVDGSEAAAARASATRMSGWDHAVYGRELLKQKLRQLRPDLTVPTWREPEELEPLLDGIIDMLGIRGWRKPAGLEGRLRYLRTVLQMLFAVRTGREFPSW